jgi:hypothetical protein
MSAVLVVGVQVWDCCGVAVDIVHCSSRLIQHFFDAPATDRVVALQMSVAFYCGTLATVWLVIWLPGVLLTVLLFQMCCIWRTVVHQHDRIPVGVTRLWAER